MTIDPKVKSVVIRFLKAFFSGAFANMAVIMPFSGSHWSDVGVWISALIMSGMVGGITGVVMGYEKWQTWVD